MGSNLNTRTSYIFPHIHAVKTAKHKRHEIALLVGLLSFLVIDWTLNSDYSNTNILKEGKLLTFVIKLNISYNILNINIKNNQFFRAKTKTKKMRDGFNRQETIALTGITSGKLSYWDKTEIIQPLKFGNEKKPTVIYSWQQILELKIIDRLRDTLSLQEIRKALDFLSSKNYEHSLFECKLFVVNGELFLIEKLEDLEHQIVLASGKNKGQVAIQVIEPFKSIIKNLKEEATKHQIYQYTEKTKGTPLEYICS